MASIMKEFVHGPRTVWQLYNRGMEAKRSNGSIGIIYVEPKSQTIVDVDFNT